ncbi:hypothetical protein ACA910_005568 [Epithemia clementina (nom. ined.)]
MLSLSNPCWSWKEQMKQLSEQQQTTRLAHHPHPPPPADIPSIVTAVILALRQHNSQAMSALLPPNHPPGTTLDLPEAQHDQTIQDMTLGESMIAHQEDDK